MREPAWVFAVSTSTRNITIRAFRLSPLAPRWGDRELQTLGNAGSNWYQDDRTYDLYDEMSCTKGRHTIMAGVEFRRLTMGREASNNPLGLFNFAAGTAGSNSTGYAGADFVWD